MERIKILNIFIGFLLIFIASCCGSFLANDSTYALLHNKELFNTWSYILKKSAHGHTNMFGFLHISLGLTLSSSSLSLKIKKLQTVGVLLGSVAMSILLFLRSYFSLNQNSYDFLGYLIALFLSLSLLAIASHCFGLLKNIVSL